MNRKRGLSHYKVILARALTRYRKETVVIAVTAVAGLAVTGWILSNQIQFTTPSWWPGTPEHYQFTADFEDASGFLPGTAQPVAVSGVQVGVVKDVKLDGRVAAVTIDIDDEDLQVYNDATLLVRPRTALKDMFVALDPGTSTAGELAADGTIPASQTQPTVDVQDILSNLDSDTRGYLQMLLAGGAEGFGASDTATTSQAYANSGQPSQTAVNDLSSTLRTFDPFTQDARRATALLAQRRENLKGTISGLSQVMTQLGAINGDITALVQGANQTFQAVGSEDTQLQAALTELPGTLADLNTGLVGITGFGHQLGIATSKLHPLARNLAPAERALRPFAVQTLPVVSNELRPFARTSLPIIKRLKPALTKFNASMPGLDRTASVFARFFNALGYNPAGSEEGYLFWGAWLSHNLPSVFSIQDAHGAVAKSLPMFTCPQLQALHSIELGNPILASIIKLANFPDRLVVC